MTRQYPYPPGEGRIRWVSTEWLEAHLDENILRVDVQPNVHDYILEHIPGAVYFNEGLLRVPLRGRPAVYCPDEVMQANFRRIGLTSQPVVVYTGVGSFKKWGDGLEQTMVAYTLVRFGHPAVYILDGGLDKWKAEGNPVTKVFPPVKESTFTVKLQRDFCVEYEEFKAMKDRKDVILLDARPSHVYEGQGPWIKPGHIPGAVNLPWTSLMAADNTRLLRPDDEILAALESKGITRDKTIICSCGTGREATNEFILFTWYLNYPKVKIYEGSFTEWTSYPENPTVTGKNPR
ncbi:MAG: sulfurtransferase [Theionarchaea archaeon]|nr:sulfurtransferase [Theionarchaea archaeon]